MSLPNWCLTPPQRSKKNSLTAEVPALKNNLDFYEAASLMELIYYLVKQMTLLRFLVNFFS